MQESEEDLAIGVLGANEYGGETASARERSAGDASTTESFAPEPRRALQRATARQPAEWEGPGVRVVELVRALSSFVRERPLTSLGVAIGLGFVVGGAMSFRAGRVVLAAAARRVAKQVLKQVL